MGDIGVAGRIDDSPGQDRLAPRLAFDDDAAQRAALHDRRDEHAVQHRDDAGFLDQHVGDVLERLRIERVADRLGFGHCCAHGLGAVLEFAADAFAVDCRRVAIPGETLDPDLGDVPAETSIAFEQRRLHARTGRSDRRRQTAGAGADHQHVGFVDDVDRAGRLQDGGAHRCTVSQFGAV